MTVIGLSCAVRLGPAQAQTSVPLPRIVNGVESAEYPTVGALLSPNNPNTARLLCSGTLIGCETFLTAAHCVCDVSGAACLAAGGPNPSDYLVFLQHAGFFTVTSIALRDDYEFPVADIAVVKLGTPVTSIAPTPIDTVGVAPDTNGTIVGFGRSGGSSQDFGLKRAGAVITAPCTGGVSDTTSVCWEFSGPVGPPGEDSNTCHGDSGGPLLIDGGSGLTVAGTTSGGDSVNCFPTDHSYDARVSSYSPWIQAEGGSDLNNFTCGSGPQVGGVGTMVIATSGQLSSGNPESTDAVAVSAGTSRLRVAMNAEDGGFTDFDLYVKFGSPPSASDSDCAAAGPNQFGFCEFTDPAPGVWYAMVSRYSGSGNYQLTTTIIGPDCTQPGSDGSPCDDNNPCTGSDACQAGSCGGTPLSGTPCEDGSICTREDSCESGVCISGAAPAPQCKQPFIPGKSSLLLQDNPPGTKDKLVWRWVRGESTTSLDLGDPTVGDVGLCLYDDSGPVPELILETVIPAGARWSRSGRGFRYKDANAAAGGVNRVVLKSGGNGAAKVVVRGKGDGLGMPALAIDQRSRLRVQLVNEHACWEARYSRSVIEAGEFRANSN